MGPRKKSKPETSEDSRPGGGVDNGGDVTMTDRPSAPKPIPTPKTTTTTTSTPRIDDDANSLSGSVRATRTSWYGSWTGKARPVGELARASVTPATSSSTPNLVHDIAAGSSTASLPGTPLPSGSKAASRSRLGLPEDAAPSPKRHFSGSIKGPRRSTPLAAAISNVSITSNKSETKVAEPDPPLVVQESAPIPPEPTPAVPEAVKEPEQKPAPGWFGGWWSRPDGYADGQGKDDTKELQTLDEAKNKPLPAATPSETPDQSKMISNEDTRDTKDTSNGAVDQLAGTSAEAPTKPEDSRGWFGLWSRAENVKTMVSSSIGTSSKPDDTVSESNVPPPDVPVVTADQSGKDQAAAKDTRDGTSKRKSSGWAFWSKETNDDAADASVSKQVGELAVANTPSQTNPEVAQFNELEEPKKETPKPKKRGRGRPRILKDEIILPSSSKTTPSASPAPKVNDAVSLATPKLDQLPQTNLVLPEFSKTYSLVQQPSVWQSLKDYVVGGEDDHPHLHIVPNPPRIKKALAIGIHGFFPAAFLQSLLGPPTGTSIRFANNAAAAIKQWTEARGYECEIEKVALEGEGLIADRVDTLWRLLLNWIEHVRSADLILLACHSQGVPVSIMLVEKLIQFKCIGPGTRIGVCAMAGVNMGPFTEYKTQIFGKSALELFDFSNQNSKVSQMYLNALDGALRHGVKILYVGSIDDQLVALDSSTFSNISHPCIYRAVFIDGRLFTSDFITELVGFALKLRNLGLPDHGLVRELSPALAGSLVGGEGHSRLYDPMDLYSLAVSHTLETTVPSTPTAPVVKAYEGPAGSKDTGGSSNPFYLPWAMRGILEEDKVRKELADECARLLGLFDEWKPVGKGLKDVKFRLEALRSKL